MSAEDLDNNRHIEEQINLNIENIENFYGLNSVDSLKKLIEIILDQKKSMKFFKEKMITLSSIFYFNKDAKNTLDGEKIEIFAKKYTYQKLVEKFPRPKAGTNRMLLSILERKIATQVISSHQTRKSLWLLASGAKFSMNMHKGLYESLLNYKDYPTYFNRSIKQDIHRTVNKATSTSAEDDINALHNVLIAFSRKNPYVGYCQGLNFIAFFLLTMQFTEQEAFWLLSLVIETIIPMDYYTNMIGVVCDQQIFINILKQLKPHIVKKFDEIGLDPSVLSIQWFVCLFTSSLPFYLVKVVWDRLIFEGTRAFIKAGLIILGYFQKQIMNVSQFHEIIMILEKGSKKLQIPQSQFNDQFEKIYINKEGLKIARNLYREYHIKQKLSQKLSKTKRRETQVECNIQWPICTANLEKCRREREQIQVWIFRQQKPPFLIHDYLLNNVSKIKGTKNISPFESCDISQRSSSTKSSRQNNTPTKVLDQIAKFEAKQQQIDKNQTGFRKNKINESVEPEEITAKSVITREQYIAPANLIIGRMEHICLCKLKEDQKQKRIKNKNDARFLSMIMEEETQNQDKKIENFKKIIRLSSIQADNNADPVQFNEPQIEEPKQIKEPTQIKDQQIRRSQTLLFYSKFVTNNYELSQIIGPNIIQQESSFQQNQM